MTQGFEPMQPMRRTGEEASEPYKRRELQEQADLERRAKRSDKESVLRRILSKLRLVR
jgi:hypothetical protein